jgi:hypothetical protein
MANGTKITSAISGPFILGPSDNPLTITSTGAVTSTGTGVDGIDGDASTAWKITNQGAVSSADGWGINLAGAGALYNSGRISGLLRGFLTGGAGKVTNKGTISSQSGAGVDLEAGGSVTNKEGASISGGPFGDGVSIRGGAGEVTNKGTISGRAVGVGIGGGGEVTNAGTIHAAGGFGVSLGAGGEVKNIEGGSISGGEGVVIGGSAGEVTNRGGIGGDIGVNLEAGGSVTNREGASIFGGLINGVRISGGAGEVTNRGTITGNTAVNLAAGGSVTNNAGGSISGGIGAGVLISGGAGQVTNAGTISGGVLFGAGTTNNRLIIRPGAVFNGAADATRATDSTIELTRGVGAISGIGNGNFCGFNTLDLDHEAGR